MISLRQTALIAACAVSLAVPAAAAEPTGPFGGSITGTVGFVSDYKFRGISQTGNNPALQGSLEYALPIATDATSLYAGVWGSNVDFFGASTLEADWTIGLRGSFGAAGYDINVTAYSYPGGVEKVAFVEPGLKLTYDLGVAVPYAVFRYSRDFQGAARIAGDRNSFARTGHAEYLGLGATVPLPFLADLSPTLIAEVARQRIADNALWGTPDYTTWTVGATATVNTLVLGLSYTGTDLSRTECFGGSNVCAGRVVFSLVKPF